MDFTSDQLADGRRFRTLNLVDMFTRACLTIEVAPSLPGRRVVRALDRVVQEHGVPLALLVGVLLMAAIVAAACMVFVHQGAIASARQVTAPVPDVAMSPETSAARSAAGVDDNDPLGLPVSARPLQILHKQWFTVGYDSGDREDRGPSGGGRCRGQDAALASAAAGARR